MQSRLFRNLVAFLLAGGGLGTAALVAWVAPASASYGPGTAYQIEISGNTNNLSGFPLLGKANGSGGGFWFWASLTPTSATGGNVDYQETDCVHNVPAAPNGAVHNGLSTTYTVDTTNDTLTIDGVITGLGPVNVTVPSVDGHYGASDVSFLPFSALLTKIQVEVAP